MKYCLIILFAISFLGCVKEDKFPDFYIYKYKDSNYQFLLPIKYNSNTKRLESYKAPRDIDLYWPQPLIDNYFISIGDLWTNENVYTSIKKSDYAEQKIEVTSKEMVEKIIDTDPFQEFYLINKNKSRFFNEASTCRGIDTSLINNLIKTNQLSTIK